MNPNELKLKFEAMVVTTIHDKLVHQQMTGERAREIARIILQMVPENANYNYLIKTLPSIREQVGELADVVHQLLKTHDEQMKAAVVPKIQAWLNQQVILPQSKN